MRLHPTTDRPTRSAAPEGGARHWVRGCFGVVCLAGAVAAQELPSGQPVTLFDIIYDESYEGELVARFRFEAPVLAQPHDFDDLAGDFAVLCDQVALPQLARDDVAPVQVVISLSETRIEFGLSDPDVTQYFELFSVEGGRCIWEAF